MFFKDLITEMTEGMLKSVNKNALRCPNCHKGNLKKNDAFEHYVEVAASKIASLPVGGSVPAPDYRYKCSNCKSVFLLIDGKFVPLIKRGGG